MIPLYDVFRAVALVVAFAVSLQDRKTTMFADMVMTGCFSVGAFLCPQTFLGMQTTSKVAEDPQVMFVYREIANMLLSPLLMWYYCRNTRDDSVVGSMLWSRSLGFVPVLTVLVYGHFTHKFFIDRNLYFVGTFLACLMISNAVQLVRTRPSVGRREDKGFSSTFCRIIFLAIFVFGVCSMAFPKLMLSTFLETDSPKAAMVFFTRFVGAVYFSSSFVAWYAPSFRSNEDRKLFIFTQFLIAALSTLNLLNSHLIRGVFARSEFLYLLPQNVAFGFLPIIALLYMKKTEDANRSNTYFTRSKAS